MPCHTARVDTPPSFTDRLRLVFEESGLTQAELARRLRVPRATVNAWFQGRSINLTHDNLFALADALNVVARWLGTGRGRKELAKLQPNHTELLRCYTALDQKERAAVDLIVHQIAEKHDRYR